MKIILSALIALLTVSICSAIIPYKSFHKQKINRTLSTIKEELGDPKEINDGSATYYFHGFGEITFSFPQGYCTRIEFVPSRVMNENEVATFAVNMLGLEPKQRSLLVKYNFKGKKPREVCLVLDSMALSTSAKIYFDCKKLFISTRDLPELDKRLEELGATLEKSSKK